MVRTAPEYILRFIDYINENIDTKEDCYITFYHGEHCVEYICKSCDKCLSYAEYDKNTKILYVPTQYPVGKTPKFLLESIAHEYWHHVQNCEGRLIDSNRDKLENEAEKKAIEIVEKYLDI